jgi:hypothetical protein
VEALPGISIIDRSSVNAFDDPKVARYARVRGTDVTERTPHSGLMLAARITL